MKWLCDKCWSGKEELTIGGFISSGDCDNCDEHVGNRNLHAVKGDPPDREPWCDECAGEPYAAMCKHPKPLMRTR